MNAPDMAVSDWPMRVQEVMTERVATVSMDDSLKHVKEMFENVSFHHVLVLRGGRLFGIVSDRDVLLAMSPHLGKAAENSRDLQTLKVRVHQIMTREVITLPPDALIGDAARIMVEQGISCIPVVDDECRVKGIVSWRDLIRTFIRDEVQE